jgi:sigma-B regulation protein RsbU (phosphoserine phosphatase)
MLCRVNTAPPDALADEVAAELAGIGASGVTLYVVDYDQRTLRPLPGRGGSREEGTELDIDGSLAGRAFRTQAVLGADTDAGWRVVAPIRERSERFGAIVMDFPEARDGLIELAGDVGRLVGHLLRSVGQYSDAVERARRNQRMALSAEIQWNLLLHPLSFESQGLSVAAYLEPAYEVGGDGFDYAYNDPVLEIAIFDAMGHNTHSALAGALALAALRHSRRQGDDLATTVVEMDRALVGEFGGETFVTGAFGALDVETGAFRWANAGHLDPLLVRGARVVAEPHAPTSLPLGLGTEAAELGSCQLEPGDALLFYSDGVVEARPRHGGEQFGVAMLRDHVERHLLAGLPADETLRRIAQAVVEHDGGRLKDDATLLMVEWKPQRDS